MIPEVLQFEHQHGQLGGPPLVGIVIRRQQLVEIVPGYNLLDLAQIMVLRNDRPIDLEIEFGQSVEVPDRTASSHPP